MATFIVGSTFNTVDGNQTNQTNVYYNVDPDQERRNITEWLSALNFSATQSDFFDRTEKGTGNWLLESGTFQNWRNRMSLTLWCPGNPGAGKTFLASIVVNHLRISFDSNVGVICIYCNYKEQTMQTAKNLIASLLRQLVQNRRAISDHIKAFYGSHQNQSTFPTLHEVTTALETEIKTYDKVFIVVDGLDECSEGDESRADLLTSLRSLTGPVNIMVTSRPLPSIEQHFHEALRIDIHATDEDVTKFIQSQLVKYPHLIRLRETIITKIVENVKGMFLVARLHMNMLTQQKTIKGVKRALDQLPSDMNAIYNQAMDRIEAQSEDDRELGKRVLSWITYARRPLTVEELQHAFAVLPDMTMMDPDDLIFDSQLTSVCAGLVVVDGQQTIRLAHYTTQQYFENQRESRFPNAEADIAATCLRYLSLDVFARGYCKSENELTSLLEDNPFLDYAAKNWGHHACPHQEIFRDLIMDFLRDDSKFACASEVVMASRSSPFLQFGLIPMDLSGVHLAASFNLDQIVRYQLDNGANPNLMHSLGRTPLSVAASQGCQDAVMILVACDDVDADLKDSSDRTPLSYAAEHGRDSVVKLLVARHDVEPDSKDSIGRTPLSYAADHGHEGVVRLLIAHGVDADSKDLWAKTPLLYAAQKGHEGVMKLLIARGVDADLKHSQARTPLSYAAEKGHEGVVKLLIAHGVDADSKDSIGCTPLSFATERGHEGVVRLLIAHGVDADSKDSQARTPLSYAAEEGHEGVMKLLIAHGVDSDSKDFWTRTPLSYAAQEGHEGVVKLLIAHGVDANSKDLWARTPLSYAADHGHEGVVRLLVAHGVDADSRDSWAQTPLSHAAENGHEGVVKLLIVRGVDADSKDSSARTPLSFATEGGHKGIVKLLTERIRIDAETSIPQ